MAVHYSLFPSVLVQCGESIHWPVRVVLCDPTVNQTPVRIFYCMDYNEEDDVVMTGASISFTEVEVNEDDLAVPASAMHS